MIETKLFELRDRSTFVPMFAVRCNAESLFTHPTQTEQAQLNAEDYLLRRAGFDARSRHLVIFGKLSQPGECNYDPYYWSNSRTLGYAHAYIEEHWDELKSGQVIDVEHLRGERPGPRVSERLEEGKL